MDPATIPSAGPGAREAVNHPGAVIDAVEDRLGGAGR